jgi:hypothetical protein
VKDTKDKTKRICGMCGMDVTPTSGTLVYMKNSRGNGLGLFGSECCAGKVKALVDELASLYGAHIVYGHYLSSPWGTPDVRSIEALKQAIAERRS